MLAGIAGAFLIFTGIWHATECLMDGRRRDTLALVPVGIVYAILGGLIVTPTGGWLVQLIALIATTAGISIAYIRRNDFEIRKWVTWAFILVDIVIILCLIGALLT